MHLTKATEFERPYHPKEFEEERAQKWVEKKFFSVSAECSGEPYTIVIPPPNVTGELHIGHVLNNTLQDILIRWQRLKGKRACWVPGTDHASIATEAKVTKMLAEQGIDKKEIGREAFLGHAWEWKEKYGGSIISALKRMGASCDWEREAFTMSETYTRSVQHAFVELYRAGLVYKGHRLVNWCPVSQSVISDEEVNSEERQGHLWHIRYPVVDPRSGEPEFLVVATTRPETLFGDLAVAVNPGDERYASLVGRKVKVPVCDREVPVVADSYVEREFGTGVVKITPAHDMNDYEVGKRHQLGLLNVMNPDASMNGECPEGFVGLDRYEARKKLLSALKEQGLLEKTENHKMVVGISERGGVPIEYYLSEQWYFKMEDLAKLALESTRTGALTLYPAFTEKIWEHWLTNIQDWCVSRQLWWGHRIPVYTCGACGDETASVDAPHACVKCGAAEFTQVEDVLDTWASSWLWPFAVHGWPARTEEERKNLAAFYPTECIVTGQDIIFFWIARMIMAGRYFTNELPFHSVYFTPIVRDEKGRKMSKSLGNSPSIQGLMDTYGTDALRFSLVNQIVLGQDIHWKDASCELGRNFANKIWNATRFLLTHAGAVGADTEEVRFESLVVPADPVCQWVLSEFAQLLRQTDDALERMNFSVYSAKVYEYFWMVFCDWFVELLKPGVAESANPVQAREKISFALALFDGSLRVLHPLMPFLTEEIWQRLGMERSEKTIGLEAWPRVRDELIAPESIEQMRKVQSVVSAVRAIRGQYSLHPGLSLKVTLAPAARTLFGVHVPSMEFLARAEIRFEDTLPRVIGAALAGETEVFVDLSGHVEPAEELKNIEIRIKKIDGLVQGIEKKLQNEKFVNGAPESVVAGAREQLRMNQSEKSLLERVRFSMLGCEGMPNMSSRKE